MDWIYSFVFFIGLFFVVGLAEGLRRFKKWPASATRKFVHIVPGILVAVTPIFLESKWTVICIALLFAIVTCMSIKFDWLPSLHHSHKNSYGTVFYPLSLVFLALLFWDSYLIVVILSMLVMAISDALAEVVGKKVRNPHKYTVASDSKSLEGSAAMLGSAFIILFLGLKFGGSLLQPDWQLTTAQCLWTAFITATIAAVSECISGRGSDNLSVPIATSLVLHFMLVRFASGMINENIQLTIGLFLAAGVVVLSYRARFLNLSGAVMTFLLAVTVFGMGGWRFSLPILAFFILSSLLSKFGKEQKKKLAQTFQKSSCRDMWQVIANGGVAGILVLFWNFNQNDLFFFLYLGSLAAVTADTWGTELGFFARNKPRMILNFKPVPSGTSGGITVLGTFAAFVGSFIIALSGRLVAPELVGWSMVLVVSVAGLLAGLFDSVMGATVQSQYRCPKCNKITEKRIHCQNVKTQHYSGIFFIDNDVVNISAAIFGVAVVWVCVILFFS